MISWQFLFLLWQLAVYVYCQWCIYRVYPEETIHSLLQLRLRWNYPHHDTPTNWSSIKSIIERINKENCSIGIIKCGRWWLMCLELVAICIIYQNPICCLHNPRSLLLSSDSWLRQFWHGECYDMVETRRLHRRGCYDMEGIISHLC